MPRDAETDERSAKIAHLQHCYCHNYCQKNRQEAVAARHPDSKRGGRANDDRREKDDNREAQAEHGADEQGRYRKRHHCKKSAISRLAGAIRIAD